MINLLEAAISAQRIDVRISTINSENLALNTKLLPMVADWLFKVTRRIILISALSQKGMKATLLQFLDYLLKATVTLTGT